MKKRITLLVALSVFVLGCIMLSPRHESGQRAEAEKRITAILDDLKKRGERALVGVDFCLGFPRGFACLPPDASHLPSSARFHCASKCPTRTAATWSALRVAADE